MYYRLNKFNIEKITTFIKQIFRYNSEWNNLGYQIVQFASGSEPLVFEQFFEENERYPIITVGAVGGNYRRLSINDSFGIASFDSIKLGTNATQMVAIDFDTTLAVQLPSSSLGSQLSGITTYFVYPGQGFPNGWGINVDLYSNFTTSPNLVASSSYGINENTIWNYNFVGFYPYVSLSENDYWIQYTPISGSTYYVGIDPNGPGIYQVSGSTGVATYSGSVVGELKSPQTDRMGGSYESSLTIRVQDKNNTARASDLAELISIYLTLGKYGYIDRSANSTDGITIPELINNPTSLVSELTNSGIFIKNVNGGGMQSRRRGEYDNIFIYQINVDLFTEWYEDFGLEPLENVDITIDSFGFTQ